MSASNCAEVMLAAASFGMSSNQELLLLRPRFAAACLSSLASHTTTLTSKMYRFTSKRQLMNSLSLTISGRGWEGKLKATEEEGVAGEGGGIGEGEGAGLALEEGAGEGEAPL